MGMKKIQNRRTNSGNSAQSPEAIDDVDSE
jgi:hypothetical protein